MLLRRSITGVLDIGKSHVTEGSQCIENVKKKKHMIPLRILAIASPCCNAELILPT